MKTVHSSLLIVAVLFILAGSPSRAVVGPQYDPQASDAPAVEPKIKAMAAPKPESAPDPAPAADPMPRAKPGSVDQIKGIGKYVFGAKLDDFPAADLQPVDPRAKGVLLKVSPYGDNYLVTKLDGLTWGSIPLTGLVVTFHDGMLIDIQAAMKAKKIDLYVADRAFKEKYGPNDPRAFPVEAWSGNRVQVTLVLNAMASDPMSLDHLSQAKIEIFDQAHWKKVETANTAKLHDLLDKSYQASSKKVISNL